jgi:hypothetical protein
MLVTTQIVPATLLPMLIAKAPIPMLTTPMAAVTHTNARSFKKSGI